MLRANCFQRDTVAESTESSRRTKLWIHRTTQWAQRGGRVGDEPPRPSSVSPVWIPDPKYKEPDPNMSPHHHHDPDDGAGASDFDGGESPGPSRVRGESAEATPHVNNGPDAGLWFSVSQLSGRANNPV